MKKIIFVGLILMIIVLSGCELFEKKEYQISEISPEKTDLEYNKNNDRLRIYYTIVNDAELTLNSKIEIKLNETCFDRINDKEVGDIPPKKSTRTYSDIRLRYRAPESCVGNSYDILITLKDVNGKILDSQPVSIWIV